MTVPADQETSWIYKADRPALARLQNALEELWGTRPNRPATLGYAITAGLVVGKLMEALEFYAGTDLYMNDEGARAYEALELARKALEGGRG